MAEVLATETLAARLLRILAGSAHALLDVIEDLAPEAMLRQAAREMDQVLMTLMIAGNVPGSQTPQRALQLEERLASRVFQLLAATRRLALTQPAACYDPKVLEKQLPQIIELVKVIAANRRQAGPSGVDHG
jgi:hypothetical protein